ncbi:MAG TPA: elongation factor P [Blastocatellia bacterium]|nr:elongation factor P [Blastocatellia bacterium]
MISTGDFKRGCQILVDGQPFTVVDYSVQSPSARGAATLVRTKVRNILTGAVLDKTFKSGDKFDEPDVEQREAQYLYEAAGEYNFLDQESFEQFALSAESLGDQVGFLVENTIVKSLVYNGDVVSVELPQFVEFDVVEVESAARGDTAAGKVMKDAKISTGATVRVPLYLDNGERILVDTTTGEFVKRVR